MPPGTGSSAAGVVALSEGADLMLGEHEHGNQLAREYPAQAAGSPPSVTPGPREVTEPEGSARRRLEGDLEPDDDDQELLGKVVDFYHATLLKSAEAQAFLSRFGLDDPGLIEHFRLGLANRTLAYRLPKTIHKKGAALRARLQELGILRWSGHEHLRGSLVVPVLDRAGTIVQLYGHKIGRSLRAGTQMELWLPARPRALFHVAAVANEQVVVAGSILDAMAMWRAGITSVVALPSLACDVRCLLDVLRGSPVRKIVLAFPRSPDGAQAEAGLADALGGAGMELHRLVFPASMSARDFALSVSDPAEGFRSMLRRAEWLAGTPARHNAPAHAPPPAFTDGPAPERTSHGGDHDEVVMTLDDRRWRIRGLADAKARGSLRLNVFVSRDDVGFHVDRFDMYSARHRASFTKLAAQEIAVDEATVKRDLGRALLACEQAQDDLLRRLQQPVVLQVELSEEERDEALLLLRDPRLAERIGADLETCGVVGEQDNLLLAYLVATSRLLAHPLAMVIQSSSAAGKSSLMSAVLSLVPDEAQVAFSAMTGQSLYYMGASSLRHKVLSIAEEEGSEKAAYSLKLLQSEGVLTIASTGKDPGTGRLVSQEYRVEGPVAIMTSTTSIEVDDELLSRCLVVAVDESPEQTARIHARQRHEMTLQGLVEAEEGARLVRLHRNAQRLLKPVHVVLPRTHTLRFPDLRVRARRDFRKLLGLVEILAVLHQHQRETKRIEHGAAVIEYVEANGDDVDMAQRLLERVDGVGLDDLPPATRRLLLLLDAFVAGTAEAETKTRPEIRFTRRQVREQLGLGDSQLKVHLRRLVDQELVLAHRAPHGRGLAYSLAFTGHGYDPQRSASSRPKAGPGPAQGRGEDGPAFQPERCMKTCGSAVQTSSEAENRTSRDSTQNRTVVAGQRGAS